MNAWLAWIVFAAIAVMLGAVGYYFSLRTLRWVALTVALAIAAYLTGYGLTHLAQKPGSSLSDMFARSADTLSSALIRPLSLGHYVPVPGRIGWLVIVVLLVLGYRALEAWTLRRQAPCLDVSALTLAGVDGVPRWQAHVTFAIARHAAVDLTQVLRVRPDFAIDRLPPDDLEALRRQLESVGVKPQRSVEADAKLAELRRSYEPYVAALGAWLIMPLPGWRRDQPTRDNWQTSPKRDGGPHL